VLHRIAYFADPKERDSLSWFAVLASNLETFRFPGDVRRLAMEGFSGADNNRAQFTNSARIARRTDQQSSAIARINRGRIVVLRR